jgi:hypothetical protein
MNTNYTTDDLIEAAFNDALGLIAMGETRDATFTCLLDAFEALEASDISDLMGDALYQALHQGVEREDIDPSWF